MKGRKRKLKATVAITVAVAIVGMWLVHGSMMQVAKADNTFYGMNMVKNLVSEDFPFQILEIVPDEKLSEIGYLVGGQEPIQWKDELTKLTSKTDREEYMKRLFNGLAELVTTEESDSAAPLHYAGYGETYGIYPGDSNWTELELKNTENLAAGTAGYYMQYDGADSGEYNRLDAVYEVTASDGSYQQNVSYFTNTTGEKYYDIQFKAIPETVSVTTAQAIEDLVSGASVIYRASSVTALNETNFADLDDLDSVYKTTNESGGAYEYVGKKENLNWSSLTFDQGEVYYNLTFQYVKKEDARLGVIYYEAADVQFKLDAYDLEPLGEYAAVLDNITPYVEASGDAAHFKKISDGAYSYVGKGKGSYNLYATDDTSVSLDYDAVVGSIYVTRGFSNNEWFKKKIFEWSGNSQDASVPIEVVSVEASSLTIAQIEKANLIYLSNSTVLDLEELYGSDATKVYAKNTNDITISALQKIFKAAQSSVVAKPVIVDYSIIEDGGDNPASYKASNVYNLAQLLTLNSLSDVDSSSLDEDYNWDSLASKAFVDEDHHYVNKNIYVVPEADTFMKVDMGEIFDWCDDGKLSDDEFQNEADEHGFGDISAEIIDENFYRKADKTYTGEWFDKEISKALSIKYIISYANRRISGTSTSLRVLDIEPCDVSTGVDSIGTDPDNTNTYLITKDTINSWLTKSNKYDVDKIEIVRMSTAEFIGKIEDINLYDMVYIGANTNKFDTANTYNNTKKKYIPVTKYNDYINMEGLIYSNIGDMIRVYTDNTGLQQSDYKADGSLKLTESTQSDVTTWYDNNNVARASGNDITPQKKKELEAYLEAGYPIVVADMLMDGYKKVSEYTVDNCSNIYEFISENIEKENIVTESQAKSSATFHRYIELAKPELQVITDETTNLDGSGNYLPTDDLVTLRFRINDYDTADVDKTYNVCFYYDVNADAKFSRTEERASENDITIRLNGGIIDPDEDGNYRLAANLEAEYQVTYRLPEKYIGILPWRLEVTSNTNSYQRDSEEGFIHSKAKTSADKQHIKVLQIETLDNNKGGTQYSKRNFKLNDSNFQKKYLQNLDDFVFDKLENNGAPNADGELTAGVAGEGITYIDAPEFLGYYKINKRYLDQFDMVIVGFTDCYCTGKTDEEDTMFGEAIVDYINSGKSLLLTHDTTSYWNVSRSQYNDSRNYNSLKSGGGTYWGYAFNRYTRPLTGMDRYGAADFDTAMNLGVNAKKGSDVYDQILKDSGNLVQDENGNWVEAQGKDIGYLPRSNKETIVRHITGLTYGNIARRRRGTTYLIYKGLGGGDGGQYNPTIVGKVNGGQITSYPYSIPDSFQTATTHFQYYQLDFSEDNDQDGESDLVVWYTINSNGQVYNKSFYDVRNNYYIYTKGNVTYSGVGHASGLTDNEKRLYVNTMIAAYQSGLRSSDISFVESADSDAEEVRTRYLTYDNTLGKNLDYSYQVENATDSSIELKDTASFYFVPADRNLVRNLKKKELQVSFYVPCKKTVYDEEEDENEKKMIQNGDSTTYLLKVDARNLTKYGQPTVASDSSIKVYDEVKVYEGDTNTEANLESMESGVTYRLELPYDFLLSDFAPTSLYAFCSAKITKNTIRNYEIETEEGYSFVNITRMGLYDLD